MNNLDAAFCFLLGLVTGVAVTVIINLMGDDK